jgi:hypothetical protein
MYLWFKKLLLQILDSAGIVCSIPLCTNSINGDSVQGIAAVFVPQADKPGT